jgi:predicted SnoaL-like aldol condensation-catalyzing enzyme
MTQRSSRTPVETVDTYLDVLYNQRRLDLIPALIAERTWRHAPGKIAVLSLQESIQRLTDLLELCPVLRFETAMRVTDGPMVTVAWNGWSTQKNGKSYEMSGIEIFRVVDGKIVEIWNSREAAGLWQAAKTF